MSTRTAFAVALAVMALHPQATIAGEPYAAHRSIVEYHPTEGMRFLSLEHNRNEHASRSVDYSFLRMVAQSTSGQPDPDAANSSGLPGPPGSSVPSDSSVQPGMMVGPDVARGSGSSAASSSNSTRRSIRSQRRTGRAGSGRSLEIGGPFISTRSFAFSNDDANILGRAEFPVLGRMNVGEHNSPLPRNRVYGIYKHYENVLENSVSDYYASPLDQSDRSVDQYLLGFEKTFQGGRSSFELRMPLIGTGNSAFDAGFASDDASVGNLAVILKRLLYCDDRQAISIGCGVTAPTGDDTVFTVGNQTFEYRNNAAHVIPFLGMYKQSVSRRTFLMSFATVDIPTTGNKVVFTAPGYGSRVLGKLEDQTLLYIDLMLGHWLLRNPNPGAWLSGFAVQGEFHYAGTLENADSLAGCMSWSTWETKYDFGDTRNRFDSTVGAIALHTEFCNRIDLRVAGLFPLNRGVDDFFDSEVIVSLARRF